MNQTQSCLQGRLDRSINAWIMGRMKRKMPTGLIGTERGRELMKDQQKLHARFLNFFFFNAVCHPGKSMDHSQNDVLK